MEFSRNAVLTIALCIFVLGLCIGVLCGLELQKAKDIQCKVDGVTMVILMIVGIVIGLLGGIFAIPIYFPTSIA